MFLSQWTDNGLNSQCCTLKGAWVCLMTCFCYSPVTNYMGIAVTMLQNVLLHAILCYRMYCYMPYYLLWGLIL